MRVPASTYRLQFHAGFRFEDARRIVPYLDALGVTDVYASPLLAARPGSTHGYDVVDPSRLNPELGSRRDFDRFVGALHARGMGLLLDVVPNHMAMSSENAWWMDVLRNGRASRYAGFFDIDWEAPALDGKVLVPILGEPYGQVLERGELRLDRDDEHGLVIRYLGHRLPLDPKTWGTVLGDGVDELRDRLGTSNPTVRALRSILRSIDRLPSRTDPRTSEIERRRRGVASVSRRLRAVCASGPEGRAFVDDLIRRWVARAGREAELDRLDSLIGEQPWLLANWRAAAQEVDYRRFFDVADLVALRAQDEEVYRATHELVLRLVRGGAVTGLRIDHVDGLWDPQEYLERLSEATGGAYVVAEKILARGERLPPDWPVAGTTGYDFLNAANDLFVDGDGWDRLGAGWASAVGADTPFEEVLLDGKRRVMDHLFASEVGALSVRLQRLARDDRHGRDLTLAELTSAFVEVSAALRVYRTYVRSFDISDVDRDHIEAAATAAGRRNSAGLLTAIEFLRRVLLLELPSRHGPRARAWLAFLMRWQQFTGPVMAKGLEDTALYRWNVLVSRNDVGSEPAAAPLTVDAFHRWNHAREGYVGLNATSTHDTKRSEDARTRIDLLSERPREWRSRVARWREMNAPSRRRAGETMAPDANEEWLLYQTMVGMWPLARRDEREAVLRVRTYMTKALREAKEHTSWIDPDERYECAVDSFVRSVLARSNTSFLDEVREVVAEAAFFGAMASLSQAVVKVASPGVPDLYEGTETWNLRLVDPDNRGGVDFEAATSGLRAMDDCSRRAGDAPCASDLLARWEDGRIKQWVVSRALRCRRANAAVFAAGTCVALKTAGARSDHVVAFARRLGDGWVVALAPRLLASWWEPGAAPVGTPAWGGSEVRLPAGAPTTWTDALTGRAVAARKERSIALADAFGVLPVALLAGGSATVPAAPAAPAAPLAPAAPARPVRGRRRPFGP